MRAEILVGVQGSAAPEVTDPPSRRDSPLEPSVPPAGPSFFPQHQRPLLVLVSLSLPEAWQLCGLPGGFSPEARAALRSPLETRVRQVVPQTQAESLPGNTRQAVLLFAHAKTWLLMGTCPQAESGGGMGSGPCSLGRARVTGCVGRAHSRSCNSRCSRSPLG